MKNAYVLILGFLFMISISCSPVFSDLSSARTLGEGNSEVIPYVTQSGFVNSEKIDVPISHVGLQYTHGVAESYDLGIKYEHVFYDPTTDLSDNLGYVSLDFKKSLIKDKLAGAVAIQTPLILEGILETIELISTLTYSHQVVQDKFEITGNSRYFLRNKILAFNLGCSIGKDINDWSIRPQIGIIPDDEFSNLHFTIGFAKKIQGQKRIKAKYKPSKSLIELNQ